jgi:cytochrome c-type biogenesis protein CcmF
MFILLTAPLGVLIGIGMLIRWKNDSLQRLKSRLWMPALLALVLGAVLALLQPDWQWAAYGGLAMAVWIAMTAVMAVYERFRNRSLASALRSTPAGFYGMILGHIGIAVYQGKGLAHGAGRYLLGGRLRIHFPWRTRVRYS